MCKVFCQNPQDKEKAISRIRNDEIRENGMSVSTTVTGNAEDTDGRINGFTALEINKIALIGGVGNAVAS